MAYVLAHRGANRVARENTLAAFRAAGALGADGVELDVRATADGVLVVHHDAEVAGRGPLANLGADALPAWLPTLDEALDVCADFEMVNVEIKADAAPPSLSGRPLAAAVAAALTARPPRPRLLVSSFDVDLIDAHRAVAPTLATGWLCTRAIGAAEAVATVADRGHMAFHPHHRLVDEAMVAAARARGLLVVTWTVNEPARADELDQLGVDVIISDAPDAVLSDRHRGR